MKPQEYLRRMLEEVALGYAWVSLLPSWKSGLLLSLVTFFNPSIGIIGLGAAVCAWYAGSIAGADKGERPICVFNGLLVGLFVAHVWALGLSVIVLSMLGGLLSGWLTVVLGRLAWSLLRLPILSLPFTLVAMLMASAGGSLSTLRMNAYTAPTDLLGNQIDRFLSAFGNLYFIPEPLAGLFLLAVMLFFSRYYLVIAVLGYSTAFLLFQLLGAAPEHLATTAWDSNAILAALLVGGLFSAPSFITAAMAILAAITAALLSLALGRMLDVAHLLPFSAPFVLASWVVLYAVVRNTRIAAHFNLGLPDFPERSCERAHVSRCRVGGAASVPLGLPFVGSWSVSQGFSGEYTHRGEWRHALDFIVMKEGKSFAGVGKNLEDFYCYNQPVLSPVYGQVWRVVNDIPDNVPGTVNVAANWGNCIIIRLANGKFALVAHLKPGTVPYLPGAWVRPGDFIGYCGNSGRSPQPHIHMHLQIGDEQGSPTVPFHLASIMVFEKDEAPHFELAVVPKQGSTIYSAGEGETRPFFLLAGRGLRYAVAHNEGATRDWSLRCDVDDQGQLILVSSSEGRCIAESTWAIFACYERSGKSDPCFDLWILACGYTPVSYQVERWQDSTPARQLPSRFARWLSALLWPWAAFVESSYERSWDAEVQAWRQKGIHRQKVSGILVKTEALIVPQLGCTYIIAEVAGSRYTLQATSTFQRADMGVSAWESPLQLTTSLRRGI